MRREPPSRPARSRRAALPALLAASALAVLLAGCGGSPPAKLSEGSHQVARAAPTGLGAPTRVGQAPRLQQPPRVAEAPAPAAPAPAAPRCLEGPLGLGSEALSYAATVPAPTVVRPAPGASGVVAELGRLDVNGQPTVLDVTGALLGHSCKPRWYRVELAVIPNGTTGWVSAGAVRLYRVTSRIVVDLSSRVLRLYRSGKVVLRTPVGIGAPTTPTPVGRYFVDERYVLASPDGPFGPDALGISAHSVALQHAWVEDGPIALHGTDEPWSIGEAASHGCIHVPNGVMRRLFALAPDGTPVIIQA